MTSKSAWCCLRRSTAPIRALRHPTMRLTLPAAPRCLGSTTFRSVERWGFASIQQAKR